MHYHVGVPENERADQMVRAVAVEDTQSSNDEIPCRDWYPIISRKITDKKGKKHKASNHAN